MTTSRLPINLDDLLAHRTVESDRIEYKAGWNPSPIIARRYRNRRIGEFLKELKLTEGRCTGIPKIREAMKANGSPPPRFSTDKGRTFFLVELPIQPGMARQAHDEAHDEAHDVLNATEQKITLFLMKEGPQSRPEIARDLGLAGRSGGLYKAIDRLRKMGILDLTIPEKPRSKNQRMKLTAKGQRVAARLSEEHLGV